MPALIVAIRGEKGNYNGEFDDGSAAYIVAIRGEKGNYNGSRIGRNHG